MQTDDAARCKKLQGQLGNGVGYVRSGSETTKTKRNAQNIASIYGGAKSAGNFAQIIWAQIFSLLSRHEMESAGRNSTRSFGRLIATFVRYPS